MKVTKRDGRVVDFNQNKIVHAVLSAFKDVDGIISDYAITKANNISDYIFNYAKKNNRILNVEEIQDLVENGLQSTKRKDVAKSYILYRQNRSAERSRKSKLMKVVANKLYAKNVQNQNANVDEKSFGGKMGEAANVLFSDFALKNCMSEKAVYNHLNNIIYTHDLSSYAAGMHNCLSIPFDDLLANGFNTRQTDVRPANSINTAFQLVAVIFQLQSLQQFGGCSATHLDWTMIPYVRKSFYKHFCDGMKYVEQIEFTGIESAPEKTSIDYELYKEWDKAYKYAMDMTIKECQQAVEGMFHNLNTLQSRSGN